MKLAVFHNFLAKMAYEFQTILPASNKNSYHCGQLD